MLANELQLKLYNTRRMATACEIENPVVVSGVPVRVATAMCDEVITQVLMGYFSAMYRPNPHRILLLVGWYSCQTIDHTLCDSFSLQRNNSISLSERTGFPQAFTLFFLQDRAVLVSEMELIQTILRKK